MSLSNPNQERLTRPVVKYIEWKGSTGRFVYYDKEAEKNVEMPKKFQVAVIDQVVTIKGFDNESESGIVANEVHNQQQEVLKVRTFKGDEIAEGTYSQISDRVKTRGGKYCKAVYAALLDKTGVKEFVLISFFGSGVSPFIEVSNKRKEDDGSYDMVGTVLTLSTNPEQKKKGSNKYFEPSIDYVLLPDGDVKDACTEYDKTQLQPYFTQYREEVKEGSNFNTTAPQGSDKLSQPEPIAAGIDDEEMDDLPF